MESKKTAIMVLAILAIIAAVALIAFLIVLLVGATSKKKVAQKVGIIGSVAALVLTIGFGGGAIACKTSLDHQIAQENKKFSAAAKDFYENYLLGAEGAENAGNSIRNYWDDAIDKDPENFDVDKTVNKAVSKAMPDNAVAKSNLNKMEANLKVMKKNDTGKYKISTFKNAYNTLYNWEDYVSNPTGTLTQFSSKINSYDDKGVTAMNDLKDALK